MARNKYTKLYIINCLDDVPFIVPTELCTNWVIFNCLWTYNAAYVYIENRKLYVLIFVTDLISGCQVRNASPKYDTMSYKVTFFNFVLGRHYEQLLQLSTSFINL
jgi:hypothetical protein